MLKEKSDKFSFFRKKQNKKRESTHFIFIMFLSLFLSTSILVDTKEYITLIKSADRLESVSNLREKMNFLIENDININSDKQEYTKVLWELNELFVNPKKDEFGGVYVDNKEVKNYIDKLLDLKVANKYYISLHYLLYYNKAFLSEDIKETFKINAKLLYANNVTKEQEILEDKFKDIKEDIKNEFTILNSNYNFVL